MSIIPWEGAWAISFEEELLCMLDVNVFLKQIS